MAAYHAAIVGNADIFKDKVVMDVGTGSGILAGEFRRLNRCFRPFEDEDRQCHEHWSRISLLAQLNINILSHGSTSSLLDIYLLVHLIHFLPVWAAQAGAKRVYAIEYTDMANHARRVVKANGVDHIVTVIQGAVEDVILPQEDWDGIGIDGGLGLGGLTLEVGDVEVNEDGRKNQRVVDIILSGEYLDVYVYPSYKLDYTCHLRLFFS